MATDGVKIIDGDLAHDVYQGIMELYDSGAEINMIRSRYPLVADKGYDDFDHEIYVTASSLAIWEIGHMTQDLLLNLKQVIDKGACVKYWAKEDPKAARSRQRELDKLWKKVSAENTKVRKIRKYKTIAKFLFEEDEVLVFQLADARYYATIVLKIHQSRGQCNYEFGRIIYIGQEMPTLQTITNADIVGRQIPSVHGMNMASILSRNFEEIMKEGGIEEMLKREAERTGSFVIWSDKIAVEHSDLINFADKFVKIGRLKIINSFKTTGAYSGATNFDNFTRDFPEPDTYISVFNAARFKIADLLDRQG